jgi:hypothetical protein
MRDDRAKRLAASGQVNRAGLRPFYNPAAQSTVSSVAIADILG